MHFSIVSKYFICRIWIAFQNESKDLEVIPRTILVVFPTIFFWVWCKQFFILKVWPRVGRERTIALNCHK